MYSYCLSVGEAGGLGQQQWGSWGREDSRRENDNGFFHHSSHWLNKSSSISSLKMCLVLSLPPPTSPHIHTPQTQLPVYHPLFHHRPALLYRCCSWCESLSARSHLSVSLCPVFDFWLSLCFSLWSRRSLICCVELETIFLRTLRLLNLFFTLCPQLFFLFILCSLVLCVFFLPCLFVLLRAPLGSAGNLPRLASAFLMLVVSALMGLRWKINAVGAWRTLAHLTWAVKVQSDSSSFQCPTLSAQSLSFFFFLFFPSI